MQEIPFIKADKFERATLKAKDAINLVVQEREYFEWNEEDALIHLIARLNEVIDRIHDLRAE